MKKSNTSYEEGGGLRLCNYSKRTRLTAAILDNRRRRRRRRRQKVNKMSMNLQSQNVPKELYQKIPIFDPHTTSQERETTETLAEIYSVILALDHVEKAFLKDSITSTQYTNSVNKLLAQYKTYLSDEKVKKEFGTLEEFKKRYSIVASNAITRIERGIPVTVEHAIIGGSGDDGRDAGTATPTGDGGRTSGFYNGKDVAQATGNFITVMDALKLNYKAKDQLHPLMAELLVSINKVTQKDFEYRQKLVDWIVKINKMQVSETLDDEEIRELLFDLEMAYKSFYTLLE